MQKYKDKIAQVNTLVLYDYEIVCLLKLTIGDIILTRFQNVKTYNCKLRVYVELNDYFIGCFNKIEPPPEIPMKEKKSNNIL